MQFLLGEYFTFQGTYNKVDPTNQSTMLFVARSNKNPKLSKIDLSKNSVTVTNTVLLVMAVCWLPSVKTMNRLMIQPIGKLML